MTARPFLMVRIRGQKDAVRVRHRARQIASLLHFPACEQTCIAAATFVIACQLLRRPGRHAVRFAIDNHQLHVEAQAMSNEDGASPANRLAPLLASPAEAPMRLVKKLPAEQSLADADLAWIVNQTKDAPESLFAEIIKQNQEVLSLLHQLHGHQPLPATADGRRPHAA